MKDQDQEVIDDFGKEWSRFTQVGSLSQEESDFIYRGYFQIFPKDFFTSKNKVGFDMGCGSGRWAKFIAPKVEKLFCVDASLEAIEVARNNLSSYPSCEFLCTKAEEFNIPDNSMDFGYSLGVLHHVSNTSESLENCVNKLKKGAPFLLYLYYKFDNRNIVFKLIWHISDLFRFLICRLPFNIKKFVTDIIALFIYYPMSRLALILHILKINKLKEAIFITL